MNMPRDPYADRIWREREEQEKANQIVRDAIATPTAKVTAKLGIHVAPQGPDHDRVAREHTPDAFALMQRVMRGEPVAVPLDEPTSEDAKTAVLINTRKAAFADTWSPEKSSNPFATPRVSALDVMRARTRQPAAPVVKRDDVATDSATIDKLFARATERITRRFDAFERRIAALE
jgi:hypothetical protein